MPYEELLQLPSSSPKLSSALYDFISKAQRLSLFTNISILKESEGSNRLDFTVLNDVLECHYYLEQGMSAKKLHEVPFIISGNTYLKLLYR